MKNWGDNYPDTGGFWHALHEISDDNYIVQDNFVVVAELIGCSYRQLQRVLQLFLDKKYIKKIKRGTYQVINLNALNLLGEDVYQF